MANIGKVLKDEIQKLARKEVNRAIAPIKKSSAALRKAASEHRQKIASLEKENKRLQQNLARVKGLQPDMADQQTEDVCITGQSIRSLRKRLRITQEEFAKLVGSSVQIVRRWEKTRGRVNIRTPEFISAIMELKSMKKFEVLDMLGRKDSGKKKSLKKVQAGEGYYQSNITAAMIKAARKKLGISQAKFARLVGMSNQVVSKWERKSGTLVLKSKKTEDRILSVMNMKKEKA